MFWLNVNRLFGKMPIKHLGLMEENLRPELLNQKEEGISVLLRDYQWKRYVKLYFATFTYLADYNIPSGV